MPKPPALKARFISPYFDSITAAGTVNGYIESHFQRSFTIRYFAKSLDQAGGLDHFLKIYVLFFSKTPRARRQNKHLSRMQLHTWLAGTLTLEFDTGLSLEDNKLRPGFRMRFDQHAKAG